MIKVVIIEDDPMVAKFNAIYLEGIPGFTLVGVAKNAEEGWALYKSVNADLILLDVYMVDKTGLELLQDIRRSGDPVDVIMITAANDNESVQMALRYGAVDYLIKPFSFERFQEALMNYAKQHTLARGSENVSQKEIDSLFLGSITRSVEVNHQLPKGLTIKTLSTIVQQILQRERTPFSAADLAVETGISRVSVRKYINYLTDINLLHIEIVYQETGRPLHRFLIKPNKMSILKSMVSIS